MLLTVIYIGIGGFIGSVSRFLLSKYLNNFTSSFPLGTLCVNVLGSFAAGFAVYSLTSSKKIPADIRDFLVIGLIGGFTTMSGFAYESFKLFELNQFMLTAVNIAFNIILSLAAVYLGKELSELIFN